MTTQMSKNFRILLAFRLDFDRSEAGGISLKGDGEGYCDRFDG